MSFWVLMLTGCAYTVEDWFLDLSQTECRCHAPEDWRSCVDERMEAYRAEAEGCLEEPAPVSRSEISVWLDSYEEGCDEPDESAPVPEDPAWFEDCVGS